MKFQFKIQQYQTDAVDAVVQVFNGQRNLGSINYIRDLGKRPERPPVQADPQMQLSGFEQAPQEDELDPTGFKNAEIELSDDQLLENAEQHQALPGAGEKSGPV